MDACWPDSTMVSPCSRSAPLERVGVSARNRRSCRTGPTCRSSRCSCRSLPAWYFTPPGPRRHRPGSGRVAAACAAGKRGRWEGDRSCPPVPGCHWPLRTPEKDASVFRYGDTHEAGIYLVHQNDPRQPKTFIFAVNPDPEEADPAQISQEELKNRFGRQPLLFCDDPDDLAGTIHRLREGKSLWEFFLAAVLAGLVLEAYLANCLGGKRLPMPVKPAPSGTRSEIAVTENPLAFSLRRSEPRPTICHRGSVPFFGKRSDSAKGKQECQRTFYPGMLHLEFHG